MTPRQEDAASRAGIRNTGWRQAVGLSALMPGNDDDFLERHDRRELFDLDDSARRREKVCTIEHDIDLSVVVSAEGLKRFPG